SGGMAADLRFSSDKADGLFRCASAHYMRGSEPHNKAQSMINLVRTGILMAALTALFIGIGYLIGGPSGMMIAFLFALGTNLFAYWNSDKAVLSMYGAREVDDRSAPDLVHLVRVLSESAG